jgi:hypothetical protein
MIDGDNINNGTAETFRGGLIPITRVIFDLAIVLNVLMVLVIVENSIKSKRVTIDIAEVLFVMALCVIAFLAWLAQRNSLLIIDEQGLLHQNWRKRKLNIAWESVKSLIQTEDDPSINLSIIFTDEFNRPRSLKLAEHAPIRAENSKLIEALKESILKHKHFTGSRQTDSFIHGKQIIWE